MCIRQQPAPAPATTPAISGSWRNADTSFTIRAPACSAASATAALRVSTETIGPTEAAKRSITGTTRSSSSPSDTGSAPGRVDSPPTSTIAAPSAASSARVRDGRVGVEVQPPSENESGVTFTTPMTTGQFFSLPIDDSSVPS